MNDFYRSGLSGRQDFTSLSITILLTLMVLVLSSPLAFYMYYWINGRGADHFTDLLSFYGSGWLFALQLIPSALALLTLLLCVKFVHHRPIKTVLTGRKHFDWTRMFFSAGIWFVFLSVFFVLDLWLDGRVYFNYQPSQFWFLVLISLLLIPFQTLFEEVLFRGYLLQAFGATITRKWISVMLSAFFFMSLHAGNPEVDSLGSQVFIYYFASGLMLAALSSLDNGLELAYGFHLVNNLFGAILITNEWQVFQTEALYRSEIPPTINWAFWLTIFVIFPFLVYIYSRKFQFRVNDLLD